MRSKIMFMMGFAALMTVGLGGMPAHAAGCNGVVSPAEWGCAPWDNNNGPQFRHYRAPARPAAPAAAMQQRPQVTPNGGAGFISHNGGGIVAQGGGNIVAQGGGN